MTTGTRAFDTAAYLENDDDIAAYLTEALATREAAVVARALDAIARARGIGGVASEAGLSREALDRVLDAGGNPELAILLRIIDAIGLRLTAQPTKAA